MAVKKPTREECGPYCYKIEQLKKMLEYELKQPENEKYGANLQHWSGRANPINIDEGAIQALIRYYIRKGGRA